VRELTSRSCGLSIEQVLTRLNAYTKGWWNYFQHAEVAAGFRSINYWIRRRLRAIIWKHWQNPRTRVKELKRLGISHLKALLTECSREGVWRMSHADGVIKWVVMAMPNAYFDSLGLFLPAPRFA
jgi:RNA-directed DNA polymerase